MVTVALFLEQPVDHGPGGATRAQHQHVLIPDVDAVVLERRYGGRGVGVVGHHLLEIDGVGGAYLRGPGIGLDELDHGFLVRDGHVQAPEAEVLRAHDRVAQVLAFHRERLVHAVHAQRHERRVVHDGGQAVLHRETNDAVDFCHMI